MNPISPSSDHIFPSYDQIVKFLGQHPVIVDKTKGLNPSDEKIIKALAQRFANESSDSESIRRGVESIMENAYVSISEVNDDIESRFMMALKHCADQFKKKSDPRREIAEDHDNVFMTFGEIKEIIRNQKAKFMTIGELNSERSQNNIQTKLIAVLKRCAHQFKKRFGKKTDPNLELLLKRTGMASNMWQAKEHQIFSRSLSQEKVQELKEKLPPDIRLNAVIIPGKGEKWRIFINKGDIRTINEAVKFLASREVSKELAKDSLKDEDYVHYLINQIGERKLSPSSDLLTKFPAIRGLFYHAGKGEGYGVREIKELEDSYQITLEQINSSRLNSEPLTIKKKEFHQMVDAAKTMLEERTRDMLASSLAKK